MAQTDSRRTRAGPWLGGPWQIALPRLLIGGFILSLPAFAALFALAIFGFIAPGPGLVAALVGAGLGGAAIKEVLDLYTANRHSAEFAAALEAGAVLLWVVVADPALEAPAARILAEAGGRFVHVNARPARRAPA